MVLIKKMECKSRMESKVQNHRNFLKSEPQRSYKHGSYKKNCTAPAQQHATNVYYTD